jgi:hypothetical protein
MTTVTQESTTTQPDEGVVSAGLILLTAALEAAGANLAHGALGGEYGYGTDFSNDVFMMHPYCWCEKEDCPWCAGCSCPDTAWKFFVDGVEVSYEAYDQFFEDQTGPSPEDESEWPAWEAKADAINARRHQEHAKTCHWCLHPEEVQPNFLHKASGSKITWYKYIGRSMQMDIKAEWTGIIAECLTSLSAGDPQLEGAASN